MNIGSIPTRLISKKERETISFLGQSSCAVGIGQAYGMKRLGVFLSNAKVSYLYDKSSNESSSSSGSDGNCDYDKLLEYFKETNEISYTVLWNIINEETNNIKRIPKSKLLQQTKIDNFFKPVQVLASDMNDLQSITQESRIKRSISNDSKIFVGVAWVLHQELRYFHLFPEVIHVGATSHSTKQKYYLLTFSVKTSNNNQVVFLRSWIPNQQRQTFRWFFKYVLPNLISKEFFKRTRLIISDGDTQQEAEIVNAIATYIPNALSGGCGWHIVDRGWLRKGPGLNSFPQRIVRNRVKLVYKQCRIWIYSFMKPGM